MTTAEGFSAQVRGALRTLQYEQENTSAPVRIQAIGKADEQVPGYSAFIVAFSDGARFRVTVAQEGKTS